MKFNSNLNVAFLAVLALTVNLISATKIPASKAPIIFATLGHPGEFNPIFHIARELANVAPSEDVWIATTEERRNVVEDAGLTFVSLGNDSTSANKDVQDRLKEADKHGRGNVEALVDLFAMMLESPWYAALYKPLLEIAGQAQPKLMVLDGMTWASHDVAMELDIRAY